MKADACSSRSVSRGRKNVAKAKLPSGIIVKKAESIESIIYGAELTLVVDRLKVDLVNANSAPRALLFGAPGLGKSATVLQFAREINRPFWWVQIEEFAEQVETKGAFQFRSIFEAAKLADAVLVFEDFDSFLKKKDEGLDAVAVRRIVAAWLSVMDDFKHSVACLAITNIPSLFDQAIMRRFDRLLYFKRLADTDLDKILRALLKCDAIPQQLITEAKLLSPAELTDLTRQISLGFGAEQELLALIEERVRTLKIAGL